MCSQWLQQQERRPRSIQMRTLQKIQRSRTIPCPHSEEFQTQKHEDGMPRLHRKRRLGNTAHHERATKPWMLYHMAWHLPRHFASAATPPCVRTSDGYLHARVGRSSDRRTKLWVRDKRAPRPLPFGRVGTRYQTLPGRPCATIHMHS